MEDENPLVTMVQDANAGLVLGGAGGTVAGNVEKFVRGKLLKNYGDIDLLPKEERKNFINLGKKYYKDYLQETTVSKDGTINFTGRGLDEIVRWNPKQIKNFSTLKKDIKKFYERRAKSQ